MRALRAILLAALATGCSEAPPPRLLLVITVDTLRADALGAYGSERGLTPHLDALAAESVVFDAAYAAAPLTLPSLATLFTGRWPEELDVRSNESALPEAVPTLAGELRERGWRTGAVVSNFVLNASSGLARGFERYDDALPRREAVRRWPERSARDATDAAIALLDGCTGLRCFVWVHYQDPHGPYDPPPGWRERELARATQEGDGARQLPVGADHAGRGAIPAYQFLAGRRDVAYYRAGYRGEVAYVDAEIGRLLAELARRGLGERTLVVFAADHGEALGERDLWFAHGEWLGDEQVRVPLFLRVPGRAPARRRDVASLADLRPTLLAQLFGLPPDPARPGRDLLAPGAESRESRPYVATWVAAEGPRRALVASGHKLVVSERPGGEEVLLYGLGREGEELGAAEPELARSLHAELDALRAGLAAPEASPARALSEAERERLDALGYGHGPAAE